MEPSIRKPRFIADQMLGRLAKWLRILGFDTEYFRTIDDSKLLRVARDEDRILLTRDTQLLKTRPVIRNQILAILIRDDHLDSQLRQLAIELSLDNMDFASFCPNCNTLIRKVPKHNASGRVPSYVFKTQEEFAFCPKCGIFFWKGTHWHRIRKKLREILNDA